MDLEHIVRPVICLTRGGGALASFYGSGFLVRSASQFYFVTAYHVLTNNKRVLSDLRIPAKLGSHDMIPQREGIRADAGGHNSFKDLLVIHLDAAYVRDHQLEDQFWPIQRRDGFVEIGQTAIALGFPEDEQEVEWEINKGTYCPVYIKGTIAEVDVEEWMLAVTTPTQIALNKFNQMSGGAVFAFHPEKPNDIILAGVILQGGRSANVIRPLSALCIYNLITHFELNDLNATTTPDHSVQQPP